MDEKHDLKMTRFENYASFVVMVENLRFMVQKTSILSKDFNLAVGKLPRGPLRDQIHQKLDDRYFREF